MQLIRIDQISKEQIASKHASDEISIDFNDESTAGELAEDSGSSKKSKQNNMNEIEFKLEGMRHQVSAHSKNNKAQNK